MRSAVMLSAALATVSASMGGCHSLDALSGQASGVTPVWVVPGEAGGIPAFDESKVYFQSGDHFVYALNVATGAQVWKSQFPSVGRLLTTTSSCVVVSGVVVCGDTSIGAFRTTDGTPLWQFDHKPDQPGVFPLKVANGLVYAGSYGYGTMYAVDAATGAARWISPVLQDDRIRVTINSVAVDSDIAVGSFVRDSNPLTGGVVALDAHTGAVRWVTNFPLAGPDSDCAAVSVALWDSVVIGSSEDGKLYLLDRSTGAIQSFFPGVGQRANVVGTAGPVGSDIRPITVSGETLYAASTGDWLIAYNLNTRRELWRVVSPEGSALGDPIVAEGVAVYVRVGYFRLTAFSSSRPAVLWSAGSADYAFLTSGVAVSRDFIFGAGSRGFWAIKRR